MKNPFRQLSLEEEIQIAIQTTKRTIVQLEIESIRHESNLAQMRRKLKYLFSQTSQNPKTGRDLVIRDSEPPGKD